MAFLFHITFSLLPLASWSMRVKVAQSCPTLCNPMDYIVHGILQARIVGWVAFPFSGDLPNPGTEPRSPTLQADSVPAEPKGSPRVLERAAYLLQGFSQSRNLTGVSCMAGEFFTSWADRETLLKYKSLLLVCLILEKKKRNPFTWPSCPFFFISLTKLSFLHLVSEDSFSPYPQTRPWTSPFKAKPAACSPVCSPSRRLCTLSTFLCATSKRGPPPGCILGHLLAYLPAFYFRKLIHAHNCN